MTATPQRLEDSSNKPQPRFVTCLSMDLIGSTAAGLRRTTLDNDRFNIVLVQQIQPHLSKLGLEEAVVKFTGDGWLVMTEGPALVPNLCCLATVMAHCFRGDMGRLIDKPEHDIPVLRLAICGGRDIPVTFSKGTRDFVGDSARRAVRAGAGCPENQILINSLVYDCAFRDFELKRVEWDGRPVDKEHEEPLVLYELGPPTPEAGDAPNAAACFIYTFDITGRPRDKIEAIDRAGRKLAAELQQAEAEIGREPAAETRRWNKLLSTAPDLETAQRWYERMRDDGVLPDVVTYSTLINLSGDLDTATQWYERMRDDGVLPDVVTYTTLINLSGDVDTTTQWYERMRDDAVLSDVVIYNTLINLSGDVDTATQWYERMRDDGVLPDVVTYTTLINLSGDVDTTTQWYERMRDDAVLSDVVIYNTLINLSGDVDTATQWYERMRDDGVLPNQNTYEALFAHDLSTMPAEQLLAWYNRQPTTFPNALQAAIASYRKSGAIEEALRIALEHPDLPAARRLYRRYRDRATEYYRAIVESPVHSAKAHFCLGLIFLEHGAPSRAREFLTKALRLTDDDSLASSIQEVLRQLDV